MTILLDPPKPDSPTFEVDHQIVVALVTLHQPLIGSRGAGSFEIRRASVLVEQDRDTDEAVSAAKPREY
jgi:hypothetical protein